VFQNRPGKIEGMFVLIEHGEVRELKHWSDELERRGIPAIIVVNEGLVDSNCDIIKNLADSGFEIGGHCGRGPLWNEPYDYQYEEVSRIKNKIQSCLGKPVRVVNSANFAYDENTLKVADRLGVEFVLARGTTGAKAVIYKPDEYNVRIISVSNVPSKEMGTGSLCDYSLWARGESPDDFRNVLFSLKEDKIILVSHTNLGGAKLHWWSVYQDFFDANIVAWKPLSEFTANPARMANAQIPLNTEVKYRTPRPKIALEQEPSLFA
jgi:peptidoglycan/xylan/chitin deacetylase (PgdA/CDA1 family)